MLNRHAAITEKLLSMSVLAIGLLLVFSSSVKAQTPGPLDLFRFKDGRILAGKLYGQKSNADHLIVAVESGAFVKVSKKELARNGHETLNDFEIEYASKIRTLDETADDHYELAGWCSSKGLVDLAKAHYRRALDINPNHSDARVAAGYDKDENGRWVKKEVIMGQKRGMVRMGRKWRFPESVVLEQQTAAEEPQMAVP